jgi:hypothetical protein
MQESEKMAPALPHDGRHGEDGAVLIILVLSLMAIFGMMVLVVDVGSLLFVRRALVNAADASALAAAQSCAGMEGTFEADFQAGHYAGANHDGARVAGGYPRYFPSCDSPAGLVRVRVTVDTPLFFAPVLGAGSETPVTTEAVAAWGGAGAGEKVAPLMLSANRLSDCEIPPANPEALPEGTVCAFWWNNSSRGQSNPDLANAEWGTLDLMNWDILPPVHCGNSTPPEFEEWMLRGFPLPLPIDSDFYGGIEGDTHTYVCRGQGNFGAALDRDIEAAATPDPDTGEKDPLYFIGFAYLYIDAIYRGNQDEALEACAHVPGIERDANARCMVTRWVSYSHEGLIPQGGQNFGVVPVLLVE